MRQVHFSKTQDARAWRCIELFDLVGGKNNIGGYSYLIDEQWTRKARKKVQEIVWRHRAIAMHIEKKQSIFSRVNNQKERKDSECKKTQTT